MFQLNSLLLSRITLMYFLFIHIRLHPQTGAKSIHSYTRPHHVGGGWLPIEGTCHKKIHPFYYILTFLFFPAPQSLAKKKSISLTDHASLFFFGVSIISHLHPLLIQLNTTRNYDFFSVNASQLRSLVPEKKIY